MYSTWHRVYRVPRLARLPGLGSAVIQISPDAPPIQPRSPASSRLEALGLRPSSRQSGSAPERTALRKVGPGGNSLAACKSWKPMKASDDLIRRHPCPLVILPTAAAGAAALLQDTKMTDDLDGWSPSLPPIPLRRVHIGSVQCLVLALVQYERGQAASRRTIPSGFPLVCRERAFPGERQSGTVVRSAGSPRHH